MHLEFMVSERLGRWIVRRGSTSPLEFASREAALKAAETLAKASAENGDTAVIKLLRDGIAETAQTLLPTILKGPPTVRYDPDLDLGLHQHG